MSTRHHSRPRDKVYILLWDGTMWSVTGSLLEDPGIENDGLDLEMVIGPNPSLEQAINHSSGKPYTSFSEATEKDKDSEGEWKGFCVYGNKTVLFGYDGLFWMLNEEKSKRGRSIRAFQNKVLAPLKVNILSPMFPLLSLFK